MRILYLCADYGIPVLGRKGAAVHVREMVAAFVRAGHEVVVVAPSAVKSPGDEPATLGAPLLHWPASDACLAHRHSLENYLETLGATSSFPGEARQMLYDQELKRKLQDRFENDPPDLIYVRASTFSTAGVELARRCRRPLVVELNAPLALEQSAYRAGSLGDIAARAECVLLTHADAVLAVSGQLKAHVISLGVEARRVHVFPNGIDARHFYPAAADPAVHRRWNLNAGPVLGFVGGLRPWHGVACLPDLLARLLPDYPSLTLVVIGDGPLRASLESTFAERGLGERVRFTGALPHEDVAPLVRQFSVALAPYPNFDHDFYFSPLKLFEYMACGVPVVAARHGQIAEIVRDGETGLLYTPGDLDALTAACRRLLTDPHLCQTIGVSATKDMHENYTWDRNASRAVELARSLRATVVESSEVHHAVSR